MRELVEFLARSLVDRPDRVEVREVPVDGIVRIEIRVAEEDVGKIIGRQGRVINAIRLLAKAGAARREQRVAVEVMESGRT